MLIVKLRTKAPYRQRRKGVRLYSFRYILTVQMTMDNVGSDIASYGLISDMMIMMVMILI